MKRTFFQTTGILFLTVSNLYAAQFLTNTPVPTEYEVTKVDVFSRVHNKDDGTKIRAPGIEVDMGLYPELQSHFVAYAESSIKPNEPSQYAYGDVRFGFKYRFIQEGDWVPQVAFYPKITLPSGDPERGIGNKGTTEEIPFWLQKSWGPWKLSGGGGYGLSQGSQRLNFPYGGILLRRDINQNLNLGAELFAQGNESHSNRARLILNVGGNYNFSQRYFMLFSAGNSIAGQRYLIGFFGIGMQL
jgi:hypothetical protein